MSLAICVRCGGEKRGAFLPCGGCGFDPAAHGTDKETQARSLLLSDQYLGPRELEEAARRLRSGEAPGVDGPRLGALVDLLTTQPVAITHAPAGLMAAAWGPLLLAAALLAGVAAAWVLAGRGL